ncbi:uncharacterized protein RCC_11208 [Ramularia collo-cygni]|uniref:Uncharacterized protein n=1 Tax=Ramularia collo-cygni TaxID=112498 RepID=A0A2D3V7S0_9PEZI|nr:uncharacterized protein RCC_11208 [Ramularia collo-cygni]CZT25476.1 uncharacterized protein RCC_11208 [Ramularia collo-cygni]
MPLNNCDDSIPSRQSSTSSRHFEHRQTSHENIIDLRKQGEKDDSLPALMSSSARVCNLDPGTELRLILQRARQPHVSGKADTLPFRDADSLRSTFNNMNLPSSYLNIADGSLAVSRAQIFHDQSGKIIISCEMIVYFVSKRGDWSLALSHNASTKDTSIFCSLDEVIDGKPVVEDLIAMQDLSFHPMLMPCILFENVVVGMGLKRRRSIKKKLQILEHAMSGISKSGLASNGSEESDEYGAAEWTNLYELLDSCRNDQASREGRYEFWESYNDMMRTGFEYSSELPFIVDDETHRKVHCELEQWSSLTWQKLKSLIARDKDHINRVKNASTLLYNLAQQRGMHLQSKIARAAQRDSQDMKFIAVLGSIFLPASLVATVLNVPEFQFLSGAKPFGAYLGITVPMIIFIVVLCMNRSLRSDWKIRSAPIKRKLTADDFS